MPGWVSALLEGDVGNPLVVASALFAVTGDLHQAVAFPGICVRVLRRGERRGSVGAPGVGREPPSPRAPLGKTGQLKIAPPRRRAGQGCPRDVPSVAER